MTGNRVWGVECGVWSVGCGVWGVGHSLHGSLGGFREVQFRFPLHPTRYTLPATPYTLPPLTFPHAVKSRVCPPVGRYQLALEAPPSFLHITKNPQKRRPQQQ